MLTIKVSVKADRWASIPYQRESVIRQTVKFLDTQPGRLDRFAYQESPITGVPRINMTLVVR